MRDEITSVRDSINAVREQVRTLMGECRQRDGREWVYASVDLGHAEHSLHRASDFVNRLLANGKRPWDE